MRCYLGVRFERSLEAVAVLVHHAMLAARGVASREP